MEKYDIKDFDGYQITKDGKVYKDDIVKPQYICNGYKQVGLSLNRQRAVHRLVAQTFIPNPDN